MASCLVAATSAENSNADVIVKFESGEISETVDVHEEPEEAKKANKTANVSNDATEEFSIWNFFGFSGSSEDTKTLEDTPSTERVTTEEDDVITIDDVVLNVVELPDKNVDKDEEKEDDYDASFYYQADDQFWPWDRENVRS